jgi:hypothetical protein
MESEKDFWRHWKDFFSDGMKGMKQPLAHPSFVLYFLVITLGVGGIGVWLEVYKAYLNPTFEALILVPRSLSTYLLAVLATASADLILSTEQTKRSMRMLALSSLLAGTALALIGLNISFLRWAYGCAILGTILALLLWLLANSDNSKLFEPSPPVDAATGGDPENIQGNLNGIIVE